MVVIFVDKIEFLIFFEINYDAWIDK